MQDIFSSTTRPSRLALTEVLSEARCIVSRPKDLPEGLRPPLRSVPREMASTMENTSPQTTLTKSHRPARALRVRRLFPRPGVHPFDAVEWELRTAAVGSFRQENVEFPKAWSQNSTKIVAQKYLRGQLDSPPRG